MNQHILTTHQQVVTALADSPEVSSRHGKTRELVDFTIHLDPERDLICPLIERDMDTTYLAAQLAWYLRGDPKDQSIAEYCPEMWTRMKQHPDDVNSNYGVYVWKEAQWGQVLTRLDKDPTSRNAIILFNQSTLNVSTTLDPVCTTSLQFLIRNDQLNLITTMRSNDWWHGFCNDSAFFMMLQWMTWACLRSRHPQLKLGWYHHHAGSLHVYERHFDRIERMARAPLEEPFVVPPIKDQKEVLEVIVQLPVIESHARTKRLQLLPDTTDKTFFGWLVCQILLKWNYAPAPLIGP